MVDYYVEFIVKTEDGKTRLICLDPVSGDDLDAIDALPAEGFARLPLVENLCKENCVGDEDDYKDGNAWKDHAPGVYSRVTDESCQENEEE